MLVDFKSPIWLRLLVIIMDRLKILLWKANGLRPKTDGLRDFVTDNPVDLILIQEVKCSNPNNLEIGNCFSPYC